MSACARELVNSKRTHSSQKLLKCLELEESKQKLLTAETQTHTRTPLQVQRERINKGQRDKVRQMCLSASEREMHQPPQQSTGRFRLRIPIWLLRQSAEVIPLAYKISFVLSSSVSLSVAWKQRRSTQQLDGAQMCICVNLFPLFGRKDGDCQWPFRQEQLNSGTC